MGQLNREKTQWFPEAIYLIKITVDGILRDTRCFLQQTILIKVIGYRVIQSNSGEGDRPYLFSVSEQKVTKKNQRFLEIKVQIEKFYSVF